MLVKKFNKNGAVNALYSSSTILATTWNPEQRGLTVVFKNGGKYLYKEVNEVDYLQLESASSTGKAFMSLVKPNYGFEKLEPVNPDVFLRAIYKESEEAYINDLNDSFKSMMAQMSSMLAYFFNNEDVKPEHVSELKSRIFNYENILSIGGSEHDEN